MEHEQINDKSVALSVRCVKMTGKTLARAMRAFMKKAREPTQKHGKQSLKSLLKQGATLADIPISGDNIGSFKRIARKYNIDFALKKDDTVNPANWVVFFKAKDDKVLESAFKEYSASNELKRGKKPSMLKRLNIFKKLAKSVEPPAKNRSKGEREL
jgi:hypothetical protein